MIRLVAPIAAAAVTLPVVTGSLPGTRLRPTAAARAAGAVEVRKVAVTGSGAQRVPLLVGRTADHRLCVGSGSFFRCLKAVDAEPVYVLGGFGGTRPEPEWGALVGLAGPEVSGVTVELQQGQRTALPLRRLPGFAWRAFVFPPTGPNGRLPFTLSVMGRGPGSAVTVDMAWVASSCVSSRACARPGVPWRAVGDSVEAPVGETRPAMEQAKLLALSDPRVRRIAGTAARLVRAPARWTSCGRKLIGAGVDLLLFRRMAVSDDLPFTTFSRSKRGRAYAEGVVHIRATGVTELLVQVDLNRGKVVGISPGGETMQTKEWKVVKGPTSAGLVDAVKCSEGD